MLIDLEARLKRIPIMARREHTLDVRYYNIWRRARARWGAPIRLVLPELKKVSLIMTDRFWVCLDASRHDAFMLAWTDFQVDNRQSLHEPIECHLNYYHFAAAAVRGRSLELMEQHFRERMEETGTEGPKVSSIV